MPIRSQKPYVMLRLLRQTHLCFLDHLSAVILPSHDIHKLLTTD